MRNCAPPSYARHERRRMDNVPGLWSPAVPEPLALAHRLILAQRLAGVELAGAADLLLRILDHLLPLGDPADRARDREQNREHVGWEPHRLQRDAGIEVDVRIELLLDEIIVVERDTLEFNCDV